MAHLQISLWAAPFRPSCDLGGWVGEASYAPPNTRSRGKWDKAEDRGAQNLSF